MGENEKGTTHEVVVRLKDVAISHGEAPLLKNVDMQLESGELVYLIGRSGAGKTSLLKSLYGEVRIESGVANVCGMDLIKLRRRKIPQLRRQIGIVFQNARLLNDRNVAANLEFVLRANGWRKRSAINEKITQMLEAVGMTDKVDAMPQQLSEGQQQRIGIARALVAGPKLLLADEPTGNLDPITSAEIMQLLLDMREKTGTTMLISTHDFMTIDRFPARVMVCENGTLRDPEKTTNEIEGHKMQ